MTALPPASVPTAFSGFGAAGLAPGSDARQRRHASRGRRAFLAASLVVAAVVGVSAMYATLAPRGGAREPAAAAMLAPSSPAPSIAAATDADDAPATFAPTRAAAGPTEMPASAQVLARDLSLDPLESDPLESDPLEAGPDPLEAGPDPLESDPLEAGSDRGLSTTTLDGEGVDQTAGGARSETSITPRDAGVQTRRSGWICDGSVRLEDPRGRVWSLGRVSFADGSGYERVVLHLDRIGPGTGAPASITAEAFANSRLRAAVPGVRRPSSGLATVSLHLADGFKGNLGLRGYRPGGLRNLKEFSVYPAGRDSSRVLVSAANADCFRLRVPAWNDRNANLRKAQILLDIKR